MQHRHPNKIDMLLTPVPEPKITMFLDPNLFSYITEAKKTITLGIDRIINSSIVSGLSINRYLETLSKECVEFHAM
tara:strand:- start:191 stop:418 length:228 start_codon:yes stop_codon:yes gene_type:complete